MTIESLLKAYQAKMEEYAYEECDKCADALYHESVEIYDEFIDECNKAGVEIKVTKVGCILSITAGEFTIDFVNQNELH